MTKITGTVIEGQKKGREFGFPTANIELQAQIEPGVYAGTVMADQGSYKAAIFVWPDKLLLEAHLLGFDDDMYGREIEVFLIKKIREVIKFDNEAALMEQIRKDVEIISNL